MKSILDEIVAERARQDAEWGGRAHDDQHEPRDWVVRLVKHLGMAASTSPVTFRRQMVRVAALAVAAIEWLDRRCDRYGVDLE